MAHATQKPFENLIIKAQGWRTIEPIANSRWKLVILDKYVDFEKLYVILDPRYNPNDEAKELNERFTLLEKNSISSKHAVLSKAEWMQLYDVWTSAVLQFYPHQKDELSSFCELIVNLFWASPCPHLAIKYDWDSQEQYSHQPYCLDSSKDVLPFPLLSQLLSHVSPPSSSSGSKWQSFTSQEPPCKRSEMICQNWNLSNCGDNTCNFSHYHNICSKYGEHHRAKDRSDCYTAFNWRQQQQRAATACKSH
jgi:hypothetical protein